MFGTGNRTWGLRSCTCAGRKPDESHRIRPPAALASVACGGAITRPPSLALACRAIAFTVVAALAACAVQNVLAQFTDPARADAADLDAMRLEVNEIDASLV